MKRWAIVVLLFIATFLFFLAGGGEFLLFGALPKNKVSCVATNVPVIFAHKNDDGTAKEEEIDDWRVLCTITVNDKKIYEEALTLAHPTKFREAMDAVDDFRTKRAAKIIKENK